MSISLEALGTNKHRIDQYGRYLIVPLHGGEPMGYTRVTTVAKTLDDGGALGPWKAAMTACGMILRRGLRSQWEALIAQYDSPWYASDETKAACKALVEECAAAGGAHERRDLGVTFHTISAMVDRGDKPGHLTEETEADLKTYAEGLKKAGVTLDPDYIEATVVLDDWLVAGTFDRLATVPGFDLPLITDIKTGADIQYSMQPFAVQLAAYSRGDAVYRQGASPDGTKDQRLPMPKVNQQYGLIIHLDVGTGALTLWVLDLEEGWTAFEHSMWARQWRKRPVAQPLEGFQPRLPPADSLVPVLQASLDAVNQEPPKRGRGRPRKNPTPPPAAQPCPVHAVHDPLEVYTDPRCPLAVLDVEQTTPEEDEAAAAAYVASLRRWLQDRIEAIKPHDKARNDLVTSWPRDLPTLIGQPEHTPDQLAAIEQLLNDVEARHRLPFPAPKPQAGNVAKILTMFPNSTIHSTTDKGQQ